jgi:protein involved in polysaccharide export with SLBB domain
MTYLRLYLPFLIFLCVLPYLPAAAQVNPQTVNVDAYTDAQIKELMQNGQAQGLSDDQIIQQMQSRGVPATQLQRLQTRMSDIKRKESGTSDGNGIDTTKQANSQKSTTKVSSVSDSKNRVESSGPTIFGADLFRNNKSTTFESSANLPTPINYILGSGDRINIDIYGNSVNSWKLPVTPEGNISIPSVGVLKVAGKTIEQATIDIKNLLSKYYAIGRGTTANVTLGDTRSIKVIIQGQVVTPGTYTMSSLSTVMNALFQAGGPNNIGSFRNIQVIRNSRVIQRMDIYDFLVKDTQKQNITLRDQDIIRVPTYDIRVELNGEVKLPALFEMLPGETLQDLIKFSGGFTDEAYTARIKVDQVSDQQRKLIDVVEDDYKTYTPLRGDKYTVERILNRYENRVTIRGAVFRPNDYQLQKGLTLSQLIKIAGGLKEDAFTIRGSIIRLNPDNTTSQISFNIDDITKPGGDIVLQREDVIAISSIFDLRDERKVKIIGEVRSPGEFTYMDSIKIADLIILAGGLSEGASVKRIEVSRRVFDSDPRQQDSRIAQVYIVDIDGTLKQGDVNFVLKPFDIVSIYSSPGYEKQKIVKVEGEVMYPGEYTIKKKNEKLSDLIVRAGGLTGSADIEASSLKRDNDAVLSSDKAKIDIAAVNKERADRLARLNQTFKDSTSKNDLTQLRNNFVGINLKKILQKPGINEDLILENGDVLRIPKQQQTVKVNGEVLYPSAVVYKSGKSFRGYVLNAGGFAPTSLRKGAWVVYPNGTVKGTKRFLFLSFHPSVKPGSEIYVPKRPERKDNLQQILTLTTSIASLGAIIFGVLSLNNR